MRRIGLGLLAMNCAEKAASDGKQPVAAFEELAMPLLNSVYNLARWLTRNDHDAEDLVQETYLKAYRNLHLFRAGTDFRAWIFRILRNTFLTSRTGSGAASSVSLDWEDERELAIENETSESILLKDLDSRRVQGAIEDLPVHYREALLLCDVEEMSYRQIAEILSIPMGTVMSRLARARKLVRDSLSRTPGTLPSANLSHPNRSHEAGSQSRFRTKQESTGHGNDCCVENRVCTHSMPCK